MTNSKFKHLLIISLLPWSLAFGQVLTFDEAVFKVLDRSPQLRMSSDDIGERNGLVVESKKLPNPVASYSVENVFGNNNWKGWHSAESRYELNQLIELGGKRHFRMKSASYQLFAAEAGFESQKLNVLNQLLKQFVVTAGAQEQLKLANDQKQIAQEIFQTVVAKVEAGQVSLIQQNKAQITLASAEIELESSKVNLAAAKERLSALWADASPNFEAVYFPFYEVEVPLDLDFCLADLRKNPALVQSHMEQEAAREKLNLEKATAIPDVVMLVGVKTNKESRDKGLILGASIPLPVFNQNQGNIQRARFLSQKAEEQFFETQVKLETKLSIAHKELKRAFNEVEKLRSSLLKTAEESFKLASLGYKEGKFEYLDMLDSQRTLFEVRDRYIKALIFYHQTRADIEYLFSEGY